MTTTSNLLAFHAMASQARTVPMHSTLYRRDLSWPQYVDQMIQPQIDWGVKRFMFHLPFGKAEGPQPMSYDSLLEARERKLTLLYRGFERSMRALFRQGVEEIVCYLGALSLDREMIALKVGPYKDDNWIDRFMKSMRPCINSGCSIAFDASGGDWEEEEPEHYAAKMLRALGTPVYIEGTSHPKERAKWLHSFDWAANHSHYWNNIADSEHGNKWPPRETGYVSRWAQREEMDGRGILMINGHAAPRMPDGSKMPQAEIGRTYHEWAPPMVAEDIAEDFDVAYWLFDTMDRMTIEELMGIPAVPVVVPPSIGTNDQDAAKLEPDII